MTSRESSDGGPNLVDRDILEPSSRRGVNPRDRGFVDLSREFDQERPLVLEIGSGKGRFLVESARHNPDRNYVGVEKSLHYYRVIVRKLDRFGLDNARVVNFDAAEVVEKMFPDESIDEVHIYFPDPWPRKKTKKRRIAQEQVLRTISARMKPEATGVFVTDHHDYFLDAIPEFEKVFECESGEVPETTAPRTNYEAKYREEGRPIYEVTFQRR